MWVPLLVILLVIAMAVGGVAWARPTPRERRIAKLRNRAARLGLRVQLVPLDQLRRSAQYPDADRIAAYGLPWAQPARADKAAHPATRPWSLVRGHMSHELHFAGQWDWHSGKQADSAWQSSLRSLLKDFPADVIALENNTQGLWLYWWEKGGEERVDEIASLLERVEKSAPKPPRSNNS